MHRIVLNCNIPDLFKDINPPDYLVEYVPQYNGLPAIANVLPPPPDAFLPRLFSECVQVCKGSKFVGATEVDATLFLVFQLSCCESPEFVTANTRISKRGPK